MKPADSLLSGLAYLGIARVSVVAMNLVTTSRLAHALGADRFGVISFGTAYVAYFLIVMNLGFENLVTRQIALHEAGHAALVESLVLVRLLLGLALGAVLLLSLPLLGLAPVAQTVVMIQGASLVGSAIGLACVYQGLGRMRVVAGREVLSSAVGMAGILCLVHGPDDLVAAALVVAGTTLLANFLLLLRYASEYGRISLRLPRLQDLRLARQSMIFFWSMLAITVTHNTHMVLLGILRSDAEVGLFSAGWKIFVIGIAVPNIVAALFFPRLARQAAPGHGAVFDVFLRMVVVCALPTAIIGSALIPQILVVLFGPGFLPAAPVLALLLANGLVVSLNIAFGTAMMAAGRQRAMLWVVGTGAVAGIVLNLALIPFLAAEGAAMATLIDEIVILVLFLASGFASAVRPTALFALRCAIAAILAAAIAHAAPPLSILGGSPLAGLVAGGAAGGLAYLLLLHLLRIPLLQLKADLRSVT